MKHASLVAVILIAAPGAARLDAQNASAAPPGWQWSLDRTAAAATPDSSRLDRMPPGWHITTGPAGLLYPSAERASGAFTLVADFVVFPATTESGFGLFLGGSGLESDSSSYLAALLRRDGASTDGNFGFKVGERVNLHITILDYIRHLAPQRSR